MTFNVNYYCKYYQKHLEPKTLDQSKPAKYTCSCGLLTGALIRRVLPLAVEEAAGSPATCSPRTRFVGEDQVSSCAECASTSANANRLRKRDTPISHVCFHSFRFCTTQIPIRDPHKVLHPTFTFVSLPRIDTKKKVATQLIPHGSSKFLRAINAVYLLDCSALFKTLGAAVVALQRVGNTNAACRRIQTTDLPASFLPAFALNFRFVPSV